MPMIRTCNQCTYHDKENNHKPIIRTIHNILSELPCMPILVLFDHCHLIGLQYLHSKLIVLYSGYDSRYPHFFNIRSTRIIPSLIVKLKPLEQYNAIN